MNIKYIDYDPPTLKEPIFLDEIEYNRPMWENIPPAWKGSSTKSGRSEKQIKKDRKNKKMNKRKHKKV